MRFEWIPRQLYKNNSHSGRRLIDKPDIFLESLDNSEQNQHRCIFNFFFQNFLGRALNLKVSSGPFGRSSQCNEIRLLKVNVDHSGSFYTRLIIILLIKLYSSYH